AVIRRTRRHGSPGPPPASSCPPGFGFILERRIIWYLPHPPMHSTLTGASLLFDIGWPSRQQRLFTVPGCGESIVIEEPKKNRALSPGLGLFFTTGDWLCASA